MNGFTKYLITNALVYLVVLTNKDESLKDRILGYLEKFNWQPESISEEDGQYKVVLSAQLDIKEAKISIRFSNDSHWVYMSAIFLPKIKRNFEEIYAKLLQINYNTVLTKFGMSPQGNIYGLIELPSISLDYVEFISALKRLSNDINKYLLPIANLLIEEEPKQ